MSVPKSKLTQGSAARNRRKKTDSPASQHGSGNELETGPESGTIGGIRLEASPALGASMGLRVRRPNILSDSGMGEKEKVSITLDRSLVEEIRSLFGQRALSTSINDLLHTALARERLSELVDEMEKEAGPASRETYEQVLAQWFEDE
jgi:hypothetical protein